MEQEAVAKQRTGGQPRAAVSSASAGAEWAALPSHSSSFDWAGGGADKIDILFGKKKQIAEIFPLTSEMLRILGTRVSHGQTEKKKLWTEDNSCSR